MDKKYKTLVVYYSLSGNTKALAEKVSEEFDADILELKPVKDIKFKGFLKYMIGGFQAIFKKKPELYPFKIDPSSYDIILIGTPIWAGRHTPAVSSFISMAGLKNKKIALFCSCDGENRKPFFNMRIELSGNDILSEMEFIKPFKGNGASLHDKIKIWSADINSRI